MNGNYLEVNQFPYIFPTFPYNSHPSSLETTSFLKMIGGEPWGLFG